MSRKRHTSGFVYIWFDRKHKRYYVGSHWGPEDDGYVCSSTWMRNAYRNRPHDFKRRILKRISTNKEELLREEHRWLLMMKPEELKGNRYYNVYNHLFSHWSSADEKIQDVTSKIITKESNLKRSISLKGRKTSEETRKKLSVIATLNMTTERRAKISMSLRGKKRKPLSEDHRKKCSENSKKLQALGIIGMRGKRHSEKTKALMSISQTGRKHTEETKKLMSRKAQERYKRLRECSS